MEIIPFRIEASKEEDNYSDVYAFLIQGNSKDAYEVEIDIDSLNDLGITDTRCTCPHYTFRALDCKHIEKAKEILGEFGILSFLGCGKMFEDEKYSCTGEPGFTCPECTATIKSANLEVSDQMVENNKEVMDLVVEKDDIQRKTLGTKRSKGNDSSDNVHNTSKIKEVGENE